MLIVRKQILVSEKQKSPMTDIRLFRFLYEQPVNLKLFYLRLLINYLQFLV